LLHQNHADLLAAVEANRVIGILRKCPAIHAPSIAAAAIDTGLTVLEVTLDSPDALDVIEGLCAAHPGAAIGAGTVTTAEEVRRVSDAGGRFVISPILSEEVVVAALAAGLVPMPGVATPTEIHRAIGLGAPVVKIFPAEQLGGPGFISAVRAPLREPRMVATGGVDATNAAAYLAAGAWAVGVGGSLFGGAAMRDGDTGAVAAGTRELLAAVAR
jgi:2-dehydro-3-deoxyphosphogluconate aldolase/(4S)-4-hydroxy-2-oxoglutarate aldolase